MARTHLEKLIRAGTLSDEALDAVRQFKKGRVRKAFLDSIAGARRLYVLGHHREAARHWMEAARWLPSGPERSRLRQVAAAAGTGRLVVDVQKLGLAGLRDEVGPGLATHQPADDPKPPEVPAQPAADSKPPARRIRPLVIAIACILVGCLALLLLMALIGD